MTKITNMQETITIKNRWSGEAIYQSTKTTLKEAVEEAVENGADLYGADLREANLREANLYKTKLYKADLFFANLYKANLSDANLCNANLYGANIRGANLNGAELMNAKFYGKAGTSKLTKKQLPEFLNALGFQVEN
jgi:uncharacterized protein YjbI with pentapeptide repeats